jgi:CelD/BcsL family acetyltransferase involved in cellulose biosynthesis
MPVANDALPTTEVKSATCIEDFAKNQYDLSDFAPKDNIELAIDWFDLLQKQVYPSDAGVRYYYVEQGIRPSTILPVRLVTKGRIKTVESLGNYYTSLYTPLLTKNSDLTDIKHLLAAATRDHDGAHVMRFAPMDPESPAYKTILNELRAIGWIPLRFFCFGNWFLNADSNWEGYLKKRSANLRSSIKRRSKEFANAGGTLEVVTSLDGIEQAIAAYQEVYLASWKIPEPFPDFIPSLIRQLSSLGMLRLGIARLQQTPIAAQLWIVGQNKASIYKVAYHNAFASISPGTVLTSHLLQYVIEHDHVKEVDFLIGDDEYKKIWMSDRRERWGIIAFNPRTSIGFALLLREISGRMAKSSKKRVKDIFLKLRHIGVTRASFRAENARVHNAHRDKSMTWSIHPISQFADFSNQWDALVRSRPGTPFLESAFLQPLIDVFGTGEERLCLFQANGKLRAATIVQRERKGIWQTFQPSQLPLGAWVTDGNIDLALACHELARKLPGLTVGIGATQLDPRVQIRPEEAPKVRTQDYIQTAWVDIEGDFETYWEARGKNLKQNTRKQRNKLQADGTATKMECITAPEDVQKAIEDYGSLESTGWKAADGTAILPANAQGHFYRKMLENFCALGRGRIYRYWFGEKVVAMDLCVHDDNVIVILKTAYDESYKAISPSTLMRQDEFQHLFEEQKFTRIEFFGKVMEWHTRWSPQNRTIFHATAYRWVWLKQMHAHFSAVANTTSQT